MGLNNTAGNEGSGYTFSFSLDWFQHVFNLFSKEAFARYAGALQEDTSSFSVESLYGVLDGLIFAYSGIKFYFDYLHCTENAAIALDDMHEWMLHPLGFLGAIAFSLIFMYVSRQGNLQKKDEPLSKFWQFAREIMQSLRNNLKAIRTCFFISSVFLVINFNLLLPISLICGLLYMLSRVFFLGIMSRRKAAIQANKAYLNNLTQGLHLEETSKIHNETWMQRLFYLILKFYNGGIDALYLYVGILLLTPACIQMMPVLMTCLIYGALCVVSRIYEEHLSQKELALAAQKIELMLAFKNQDPEFHALWLRLQQSIQPTYWDVLLLSIKDALPMQGFTNAFLLTISGFSILCFGVALSPAFFSMSMSVGGLGFIGMFVTTLQRYRDSYLEFNKNQSQKEAIIEKWKQPTGRHLSESDEKKKTNVLLECALSVETSSLGVQENTEDISILLKDDFCAFFETKAPEYCEVARSAGASGAKARKCVEFVFNFLQTKNSETGHYQDTFLMSCLMLPAVLIYFPIFTARAIVKGFKETQKERGSVYNESPSPSSLRF